MSPGLRHPLAMIWLFAGSALAAAPDAEVDVRTGLVKAGAWEEVRAYCGACHSLDLVTSRQNSAEGWQETVRSMRRSHNMVELPTQTEARIVDYLTRHFAPGDARTPSGADPREAHAPSAGRGGCRDGKRAAPNG